VQEWLRGALIGGHNELAPRGPTNLINKVNGTPPIDATADVDAYQEEEGDTLPPQDHSVGAEERNQYDEILELTANAKILDGRFTVYCNIFDAIGKCIIKPIQLFHKQRLAKEEAKQIKVAIKLPQLSDTSQ
jgi:hypothetical protein